MKYLNKFTFVPCVICLSLANISMAKNIVIRGIATNSEDVDKIMNVLNKTYLKTHKNVTVKFDRVPFSEIDRKIITSFAGGVNYDIVDVNNTSLATFAKAKVLAPLTSFIKNSHVDKSKFSGGAWNSTIFQGVQYAMPYETDTRVLAVNMDLLKKYNLKVPKNTADMLNISKTVYKDTNNDGLKDNFGILMRFDDPYFSTYDLGAWLLGNGEGIFKYTNGKYQSRLKSKGMTDYLKWSKNIMKYQPSGVESYTLALVAKKFHEGQVAMFVFGPWSLQDSLLDIKNIKFNMKLITNPVGSVKSGGSMGGWHMGIGSGSKHKQIAWDIIKTFTADPKNNAEASFSLPVMFDSYNYPPFKNKPVYDIFKKQLASAQAPNPMITDIVKVIQTFNLNFQKYMFNKLTLTQAQDRADKQVQKILDKQ